MISLRRNLRDKEGYINTLSYLLWITYLSRDPKVLLHCFLLSALLLSLFRQLDTELRNSLFTNGISIQSCENNSLGRKCLGVSLAHPDSSIYQKPCYLLKPADLTCNEMKMNRCHDRIFSNRIKKIQINRSIDSKSKLKKLYLYLENQDTDERFISKIYTVSFFIIENDSAQTVGRLIEDKMHTCITFNKICFGGRIRC